MHRPQRVFFRRALFQIHLWTGIGLGLYMFMIGLTGSILVYRNELSRCFSPVPVIVEGSGEPLRPEAITETARRAYPEYKVGSVQPGPTPSHAVEVNLSRNDEAIRRIFHPFTGADLGDPLPAGYRFTKWMLDLHDNLLAGETGRRVNGFGALFLLVLCLTGAVIWWPGSDRWRRSLSVDLHANWNSINWSVHSAFGAWLMLFSVMWAITGLYLSYPAGFQEVFDWIEPLDEANPVDRVVDRIMYWLAYLHFGRLGGRGIPLLRPRLLRRRDQGRVGGVRHGASAPVRDRNGDVVESRDSAGHAAVRAGEVDRPPRGGRSVGGSPRIYCCFVLGGTTTLPVPFERARAAQDAFHPVVAFVARVLVQVVARLTIGICAVHGFVHVAGSLTVNS